MATKDNIRLLYVTTIPLTFIFLNGHIAYMKKQHFHVSALSTPGPGLSKVGEAHEIPVYGVRMERRFSPAHDLVALIQIILVLLRVQPHIVHSHTPKGGLLGMVAAWLTRVPVRVYHLHGLRHETETGFRRWVLEWSTKISCAASQQVICVSHSVREAVIANELCKPEKISVLANGSSSGIDAETRFNPATSTPDTRFVVRNQFNIPADALVIGYVGRIVRDKGIQELAQAWATLREEVPNLHLLIVGDFEAEAPVPPEVQETLKNDPRVHLTGFVSDMPVVYTAMDVLALPSYREGFANVLLEAAAMALPVVSTKVQGCIDAVLDGVTGTLVPARNADALCCAIRQYLVSPELRKTHGQAARERALKDFQPEPIWRAVYEAYVRLLQQQDLWVEEGRVSEYSVQQGTLE